MELEVIGEGATTKIYRDGDRAVKLYLDAPPDEADKEYQLQAFAYRAGLPVPEVYGVRRLNERMTALDMKYIPGKTLIRERMDREERNRAIGTLARLQNRVHRVDADGLPRQRDRLEAKIARSPIPDGAKARARDLLARLDDGRRKLCHGDFHPANILFDGERFLIIDWVDAAAGSPLIDACRTYLLFKQYIFRSAEIYLRLFCAESGARREGVLAYLPAVAAARLSEPMDEKRRALLLGMLERWMQTEKDVTW